MLASVVHLVQDTNIWQLCHVGPQLSHSALCSAEVQAGLHTTSPVPTAVRWLYTPLFPGCGRGDRRNRIQLIESLPMEIKRFL